MELENLRMEIDVAQAKTDALRYGDVIYALITLLYLCVRNMLSMKQREYDLGMCAKANGLANIV